MLRHESSNKVIFKVNGNQTICSSDIFSMQFIYNANNFVRDESIANGTLATQINLHGSYAWQLGCIGITKSVNCPDSFLLENMKSDGFCS